MALTPFAIHVLFYIVILAQIYPIALLVTQLRISRSIPALDSVIRVCHSVQYAPRQVLASNVIVISTTSSTRRILYATPAPCQTASIAPLRQPV